MMVGLAGVVPAEAGEIGNRLAGWHSAAHAEAKRLCLWCVMSSLLGKGERSDDMTHGQAETTYFPHERLVAWELALEALEFVAGRREKLRGLPGGMGGQLERGGGGGDSNICGGGAGGGGEARRHFRIALSEAGEAGGCARGAYALGALAESEHAALRATLLRLCACLRGLTR